jgi:CubicO group peptidase (beta-lactamase class C family)
MADTGFLPAPERAARCAATEQLSQGTLCGVVHDENARWLGGVGGNAGLFGTAEDLARFVRMLLHGGELEGVRVLRPETVAAMTAAQHDHEGIRRGLGWDIASTHTPHVRGDFPGGFGHTGYTGTSVWVHPQSGGYVILLTNRVHLGRDREIAPLRREVANLAAAAVLRG